MNYRKQHPQHPQRPQKHTQVHRVYSRCRGPDATTEGLDVNARDKSNFNNCGDRVMRAPVSAFGG